jgi:hypothetical protein
MAAQVHVGRGLEKINAASLQAEDGHIAVTVCFKNGIGCVSPRIQHHKAHVMAGTGILRTNVPEPCNQVALASHKSGSGLFGSSNSAGVDVTGSLHIAKDGILVGEVVNMSADECILTDGKVDLGKLQPIVFDAAANTYRALGEVVGQAWGSGKKFTE